MMLDPFLVILDAFEPKKHAPQYQSPDEKHDARFLLSKLRGANRQNHSEAAANQYTGVDRADGHVHEMAGGSERLRIHIAIHRVAAEHSPEKHDFGEEKYPHPQRGRFHLLGGIVEVVLQLGWMFGGSRMQR